MIYLIDYKKTTFQCLGPAHEDQQNFWQVKTHAKYLFIWIHEQKLFAFFDFAF